MISTLTVSLRIGFFVSCLSVFLVFLSACAAHAAPDFSQILEWPYKLQAAATPAMEHITEFHNMLLYIITGIVIFVTALLLFVMVRFNAKANPTPSTTTHNVLLEVLWTVVPVVILIVIAVPSFKLLFFEARNPAPELTIKVTGNQWNWSYEYPDNGEISFTATYIKDKDLDQAKGQKRLLSTDSPLVVPVDTNIVFEVTASDVIHSFAVPAFGIKIDAVPGRLNSAWARADKTGTFFGQCSEICGVGHGLMPIEIKVVTKDEFAEWIVAQGGSMPAADAVVPEATPVAEAPVELPVPNTDKK
ncbi:MAG: cytochrome c oxidase subunit II [Alphaproteobacteria bacterium CG1_02_46_17]|nr:MAG: cytochrome c oxidase subunit II [Alphaproteobacteria bacterium CG1_02_46_17]